MQHGLFAIAKLLVFALIANEREYRRTVLVVDYVLCVRTNRQKEKMHVVVERWPALQCLIECRYCEERTTSRVNEISSCKRRLTSARSWTSQQQFHDSYLMQRYLRYTVLLSLTLSS